MGIVKAVKRGVGRVLGEKSQPSTSNVLVRRTDQRNHSHRITDIAVSYGDAKAHVIDNGRTALAMAKSADGMAFATTDGISPKAFAKGNARAGVTGGTAWARTGDNRAMAHSTAAQKRHDRRIANGGQEVGPYDEDASLGTRSGRLRKKSRLFPSTKPNRQGSLDRPRITEL